VVAFDNGATAEVLRGNMGLLVRPLDTRGIVKAISILLKDDDLYANTAKRAQEYVRKYFDFPLLMGRIEKLLAKQ
jgi:glycosyltransferase involved in cell wall biosynthesis